MALKRAKEAGISSLRLLSDSLPTIQAINKATQPPSWSSTAVLWSIWSMDICLFFYVVDFHWLPRKDNSLAHDLCTWARKTNFTGFDAL